jgi:signal transduction histidine kinase
MLRSVRPPRFDAILALALAAAAQAEVWSGLLAGPKWATLPASLAYTLPLAWRRRAPLPVAVLVVASALIQVFASVDLDNGVSWFVAFLVVMYSLGAYGSQAPAIAGLAFAVGFTGVLLSVPDFASGDYVLWVGILAAAPWAVGRALRRRQLQAAQLEDRAARLEREREEQARIAVAAERARIARELHDIVAHSVSVMVVHVGVVRRRIRGDHREESDLLSEVEGRGRQAIAEMRRLLGLLRTDEEGLALAPQPTLERLPPLLEQVREAGLPVDLRTEGDPVPLPAGIDLAAYRIVQEALTNALKHAGPAHATVAVRYAAGALELEVTDDGRGAGPAGNGRGHGLIGMRERAALYGGTIEAGPAQHGGFAVRAHLPLEGPRT